MLIYSYICILDRYDTHACINKVEVSQIQIKSYRALRREFSHEVKKNFMAMSLKRDPGTHNFNKHREGLES